MGSIRQKIVSFTLALAFVGGSARGGDGPVDPNKAYNDRMGVYGDLLKARAEYGKMLIEARLADSKIQLAQAEAEYKTTLAAALRVQLDAMKYELTRIQAEDAKMGWKIAEIESLGECTNNLSMGNANPTVIHHCLGRFLFAYVPAGIMRDVMKAAVPGLAAPGNFRANDETVILEDFPGGNMGQLMDFVGGRNMSLVRWSPAHFHFLDLMTALVAHAEAQIAKYQSYMVGIRAGTLNIWTLPKS